MDVREATRIALLADSVLTGSARPTGLALEELLTNCAAARLALSAARRQATRQMAEIENGDGEAPGDPQRTAELERLRALTSSLDEISRRLARSMASLREAHTEQIKS